MNYDKNALRYMGVYPEKMAWFNRDYSAYHVDPNPIVTPKTLLTPDRVQKMSVRHEVSYVDKRPARSLNRVLFAVSLVFLLVFAGSFAAFPLVALSLDTESTSTSAELLSSSVWFGVVAAVVAFIFAMCFSRRKWIKVIGFILASLPLVNLWISFNNKNTPYLIISGALVLGAFVFGFLFSKSLPYKQRVKAPKVIYRKEMVEIPATYSRERYYPAPGAIHGTPGGVGTSENTFSQEAIAAGVKGEENTAEMLKLLLKIPGTSIFHGLKFPGSRTADVDHAVSHGNTVYLLDSKMFRSGVYEWDRFDEVILSSSSPDKKNHMDAATKGYRAMMSGGSVIPLVIIHGRDIQIGQNRWSANGVGLFTAQEAMEFMGDKMSLKMPTWSDNPALRATLLINMK